ncbi:mitochondrial ubiquitin ligase activator of nfkb 1-A [Kryptolebias marmoratus]|uniref:RING-type E3 ubiquitin transferase n=1 Tax=Kryptolebias marmoratus TaxID=37003 RepID=A0A3Q3EY10_KRYMA|nr:mitochondrial ubiquitin ligase activator of nfkb 1-A [Kryptolebias marmoratus]XP_017277634.1 mitochondrial ubiquitin ligase activator of nfkb 1-A [Kryptolebias marmoratus]
MDGFPVTLTEAVCLGASFAFSGLFYCLYKKSQSAVNKLENAPRFTVDEKLKELLKVTQGACLQYAVIEGTVKSEEKPLTSQFQKEIFGVFQKFTLKEHKLMWNGILRTWIDTEHILHQRVNMVPFLLVGLDKTSVKVLHPLKAAGTYTEITYEKFIQASYGFGNLIEQYVSGVKPKGQLEIEEMLKVGTTLIGVGEVRLDADDTLCLLPPSDGSQYFLSTADFQTLLSSNYSTTLWWKALAVASSLAGAAVLLWVGLRYYRHLKFRWEQEQERRMFAEQRAEAARQPANEARPENVCVICLHHPRDCILLNCGHVCCCYVCYQALPQRKCPICRQRIDRVLPVFQP